MNDSEQSSSSPTTSASGDSANESASSSVQPPSSEPEGVMTLTSSVSNEQTRTRQQEQQEPQQQSPRVAESNRINLTQMEIPSFLFEMSDSSIFGIDPNNDDSFRTTTTTTTRRHSPPPTAVSSCRRKLRTVLRCICFPIMVLTTLAALLLFIVFIGFPFLIFLAGLLTVYYCCTSDPIPFRTLLRAMVGVEDWNGGAFDGGNGGEPYRVTKEDIRKGIIRRYCLGPMEWKAAAISGTKSAMSEEAVGGDLSTLPRDHPGRVHWRHEATSETCLVFSEPLGITSSGDEPDNPKDVPSGNSSTNVPELLQSEEFLATKVPKYLQQHTEEELKEKEETKEEEGQFEEISPEDKMPSTEVEPVEHTKEVAPVEDSSPVDDDSSVRDRGKVCDICLLEFETGEAVAWSPNPKCNHAYHEDCITDWLLRKPTCPSCREDFIILPTIRNSSDEQSSGILDALDDSDNSMESENSTNENEVEAEMNSQIGDGLEPPTTTSSPNNEGIDIEMGLRNNNNDS